MVLVDNHRVLTDLLTKYLNSQPRTEVLFAAESGLDLEHKLDPDNLPDVVVLDIRMPDKDGYLTAEWLNNFYPSVRVLVLTAFKDEDMLPRMKLHDVRGIAYKTDGHEAIYQAILDVFDNGYHHHDEIKSISAYDVRVESERQHHKSLNARRYELYPLLCTDLSKVEIAKRMEVSYAAVKRYTEGLFAHHGVKTRSALVSKLHELGLVPPKE